MVFKDVAYRLKKATVWRFWEAGMWGSAKPNRDRSSKPVMLFRRLAAELANGRLAMMAIIGMLPSCVIELRVLSAFC